MATIAAPRETAIAVEQSSPTPIMSHAHLQFAALAGRTFMSVIFLMSGTHKLMAWDETVQQMYNESMTAVPFFLGAAAAVELAGGLSLLLGCCARLGALMLFLFLIPVTYIFHDFWTYEGQEQQMQMINFMKNLTIMGGLLILTACGAGRWNVDRSPLGETLS